MRNEGSFGEIFSVATGVLFSLLCSLFLAVVFASVLRFCSLSQKWVYPVNQGIKVISLAVGIFSCIRGEKGWLKGGAVGLFFTMLSYLTFSAIGGDFSLSWLILAEVFLGVFSGALCGIIAVNLRR